MRSTATAAACVDLAPLVGSHACRLVAGPLACRYSRSSFPCPECGFVSNAAMNGDWFFIYICAVVRFLHYCLLFATHAVPRVAAIKNTRKSRNMRKLKYPLEITNPSSRPIAVKNLSSASMQEKAGFQESAQARQTRSFC